MSLNVISSTKTVDYISNCVEPFHFISFCLIVSDRWYRRSRCCGSTFLNWKRYVNHSHIHFFLSFLLLFLPSSFSSPLISAMHHQINYIHVLLLLLVGRRRRCRATPRHATPWPQDSDSDSRAALIFMHRALFKSYHTFTFVFLPSFSRPIVRTGVSFSSSLPIFLYADQQ